MSDIVKNTINSITFQFPLKGDDFKNESILAYNVQKFKEENFNFVENSWWNKKNHQYDNLKTNFV